MTDITGEWRCPIKVPLVGSSKQERSFPFDFQRSVNLYPVFDQEGKEAASLYGTPGLSLYGTAGTGPGRGCFFATNGRGFTISGTELYEVFAGGSTSLLGTLNTRTGNVSIDENGFQLMIVDGQYGYILTYATNVFTQITDTDFPIPGTCTFIDGYFVVNKLGTGQFYISAQYNGLNWAPLDFATAESSPDALIRVIQALGQLWLLGDKTSEVWTDTGASAFPFERISGAKLEVGILAPLSAVSVDNTLVWIAKDNNGQGIVVRAQGFTPQRISTGPIEMRIQAAPNPTSLRAYTYQEDGHTFYIITGGGMETTLCYDLSTKQWFEKAFLNAAGQYELHLAAQTMFAFGQQLAIDRINGNIYTQALNLYDDNGEEIAHDRIFQHISDENKRFVYNNLTLGIEVGVGTQSGLGYDPQVVLYQSRDGGKTFSGGMMKTIGKVGKYLTRVCFKRLGMATQMTFRIRVTSPVKFAITGAYLNA